MAQPAKIGGVAIGCATWSWCDVGRQNPGGVSACRVREVGVGGDGVVMRMPTALVTGFVKQGGSGLVRASKVRKRGDGASRGRAACVGAAVSAALGSGAGVGGAEGNTALVDVLIFAAVAVGTAFGRACGIVAVGAVRGVGFGSVGAAVGAASSTREPKVVSVVW